MPNSFIFNNNNQNQDPMRLITSDFLHNYLGSANNGPLSAASTQLSPWRFSPLDQPLDATAYSNEVSSASCPQFTLDDFRK